MEAVEKVRSASSGEGSSGLESPASGYDSDALGRSLRLVQLRDKLASKSRMMAE